MREKEKQFDPHMVHLFFTVRFLMLYKENGLKCSKWNLLQKLATFKGMYLCTRISLDMGLQAELVPFDTTHHISTPETRPNTLYVVKKTF